MDGTIPVVTPSLKSPSRTRRSLFLKKARCFLRLLIVLVIWGLSAWFLMLHFRAFLLPYSFLLRSYLRPPKVFALVGLLLLSLYLTLIVHECGHALSARLLRYRLLVYVAGPLEIERTRHHYRLGLHKSFNILEGYVSALPQDARNLRWREIIVFACGPLANLLQSGGCLLCLLLPGLDLSFSMIWFLRFTVGIAFLSCVVNSLPLRTCDGSYSDGAALLLLLKGGPPVDQWCAIEQLWMAIAAGKLPQEWDTHLLQQAIGSLDRNPENIQGYTFAYCRALEEGDVARARDFLERRLSHFPKMSAAQRKWLALEAAYFEARYHHNAKAARAWLTRAKNYGKGHSRRFRAEAAVLLAEGEHEKARLCIEKGLQADKETAFVGAELLEKRWLHDLAEVARAGK
jgi:hypothetical protein